MNEDDILDDFESDEEAIELAKKLGRNAGFCFTTVGGMLLAPLGFGFGYGSEVAVILGIIAALVITKIVGEKVGVHVLVERKDSSSRCIGFALLVLFTALVMSSIILEIANWNASSGENLFAIPLMGMLFGFIPAIILGVIYSFVLKYHKKRFRYEEDGIEDDDNEDDDF